MYAVLPLLLAFAATPPDRPMTVIDLSDDWAPTIFSETDELPQSYRALLVGLANERADGAATGDTRRDRFYELYGISPTFSVIRRRLLDERRHACHAAIDDEPLRELPRQIPGWDTPGGPDGQVRRVAVEVVQQHLACEGLLSSAARQGALDGSTRAALAAYQRRHMIPSLPGVDAETRATLLTDSRELDFLTLLRVLRERVVDTTGLIEDGSALNAWEPVLGRFIDSPEYRRAVRPDPLPNGAPDLIARATEAAARALGWTSPGAAALSLRQGLPSQMPVRLPASPAYYSAKMDLRVEIDRGDVWTSYPLDAEGRPRRSPAKRRPTLTLYARTVAGEVALVRWPTTIGAWKSEKLGDESVGLRYKASPVGRFYWRDLVAAPAWFPPPSTPDQELVRRTDDGRWRADQEAVGPGYRSAYGLVALLHDRLVVTSAGTAFTDIDIRTHGSGNYRSILRGSSHGCHRLFNHLAIRLGGFLLAHRDHARQGAIAERYARIVHWKGRVLTLRADTRGYRYTIEPPVPVEVLPGRIVHSRVHLAHPPVPEPAPPRAPDPTSNNPHT